MITLRRAEKDDACAVATLLRRSITELCHTDHKGDAAEIEAWTANKTSEQAAVWIDDKRLSVVLAERAGALAGVGAVDQRGEIHLLYVDPAHRFSGVSDRLLDAMVRTNGALRLTSTLTAQRFYEARGWRVAEVTAAGDVKMHRPPE